MLTAHQLDKLYKLEVAVTCLGISWSVPCFRVEFRSVPFCSVPENRDGLLEQSKSTAHADINVYL